MFSTSALKESQAYVYYWFWFDDRSDDHLYEKTIAKALDIIDIVKFLMGMSAQ